MIVDEVRIDPVKGAEGENRKATFQEILTNLLGDVRGLRAADLGAGPCIFSRIASEFGCIVTAVDGRTERRPAELGNIQFVQADVRSFPLEEYDLIFILGLLYHLKLKDQVELLQRTGTSSVVVDTQVHIPNLVQRAACIERGFDVDRLETIGGYKGVLFPEADNAMASLGNKSSWWHTEESLVRLFRETGYERLAVISPPYVSKYGGRRWYIARRSCL